MKLRKIFFLLILLGSSYINNVEGARILAVFQLHAKSHFVMFEALMKGLAAKGHDVVVVSHFPQPVPIPNYTDISVKDSLPTLLNSFTLEFAKNQRWKNLLYFIWNLNVKFCEKVFDHPQIQKLIKSNESFDLVITESFGADCFTAFAYKFSAPQIIMSSMVTMTWVDDVFGNPNNPAYVPIFFLSHTDKMSFPQRVINTVANIGLRLGYYYFSERTTQELVWKHFGKNTPPLGEIAKNFSLILVNSHFSLSTPRPMLPTIIEVGGLHLGTPKRLPKDLERYINDSSDGVIYFSLGSLVRSETFSPEEIKAFVDAFAQLPQRVIWKTDSIPGLPKNVLAAKWLPQFDILSHPNVRVFITHGGLMGTQEAVYNGVPMVGIPFYADQHHNIENYESKGIAVKLDYNHISKESVLSALRTILNNPRYRENAKSVSKLFRDRPQTSLETAIYWTEYVIRHRGAPHLRSVAADLSWYQYFLIDVIFTLLATFLLSLVSIYSICKRTLHFFLSFLKAGRHSKSD